MDNHTKIEGIDCYGKMHEGQNIEIVCDDEGNDGVHCDGFTTWTEAVAYLNKHWNGDIVQLSAI